MGRGALTGSAHSVSSSLDLLGFALLFADLAQLLGLAEVDDEAGPEGAALGNIGDVEADTVAGLDGQPGGAEQVEGVDPKARGTAVMLTSYAVRSLALARLMTRSLVPGTSVRTAFSTLVVGLPSISPP